MSLITEVDILDECRDNFLTYSAEVLTDRAIPSAEDGLLSAQRKILWTMEDYLKMNNKSKTKKCNAIVGSTLATSYFHGDQACYGVLCKMSQDYLMRYPLIQGQGSLGTQENNDMVASSRYTEAKPSKYADLMMNDFKKNVVPLKETYNNEFMEPVVLPALFPNALCNGKQAIGISMAHNSLPNNLTEVCNAIIAYIDNNDITIDEIMEYIPGPDFPLPNVVINKKDIKAAFATGRSSVSLKVRGVYTIEKDKIIFSTIPYRTYRNKIKEQIDKNIEELESYIDDFDDESSLGQNRLVFKVKKGVDPEKAVLKLFALTDLQTTLSYNMNYIVNGTPKLCSIKDLIQAYVSHQSEVLIKAAEFDLAKAEARKHILEGLILISQDIDNAIAIIRASKDRKAAETALIQHYNLSETQAKAILDMKLAKLTKLDQDDLLKELEEQKLIIAKCDSIINDINVRNQELKRLVNDLKDKYGDSRRTELAQIEVPKEEKEIEEVIPEDVVVIMTKTGEIKRIPRASFRTQRRNGKGINSQEDSILETISTNTIDTLMFFTSKGQMYRLIVDNVPVGNNTSKGINISNLISLEPGEKVIAVTSLHRKTNAKYVVFITKKGMIKKTCLEEYGKSTKNRGVHAIKLKEDDGLAEVTFLADEDLILITKKGMSIHFETAGIAPVGRIAMGVKSIKLNEDDEVVAGLPIHKQTDLVAIFTTKGLGKKIPLSEFPVQGRAGKGLSVYKDKEVIGAAMVCDEDNIAMIGRPNSICISAKDIPLLNRASLGNIMINGSEVISIVKL